MILQINSRLENPASTGPLYPPSRQSSAPNHDLLMRSWMKFTWNSTWHRLPGFSLYLRPLLMLSFTPPLLAWTPIHLTKFRLKLLSSKWQACWSSLYLLPDVLKLGSPNSKLRQLVWPCVVAAHRLLDRLSHSGSPLWDLNITLYSRYFFWEYK